MLAGAGFGIDDFVSVDQSRATPETPPGGAARYILGGTLTLGKIRVHLGPIFLKHDSRYREASVFDIRNLDVLIGRTATLRGGIAHGCAHHIGTRAADGNV